MASRYVNLNTGNIVDFVSPAMTAKQNDRAYHQQQYQNMLGDFDNLGKVGKMVSMGFNTSDDALLNEELDTGDDSEIVKKLNELQKQYNDVDLKLKSMGEASPSILEELQWDGINSPTLENAQKLALKQRLGGRSGLYA